MTAYVLWILIFLTLILVAGVFARILKHPSEEAGENEADLSEWICPTCGFHVQMGTECIYCGEKKPDE
ncbi:MAG: hypothetical protein V3U24_01910 [Candidatus Neomarinimicrobiota bacterium]